MTNRKSPATKAAPAPASTGEFNVVRYADGQAEVMDDSTRQSRYEAQRLLTDMCNAYRSAGWWLTMCNMDVVSVTNGVTADTLRVSAVVR